MQDLSNIKTIKNILKKYNFRFSKALGQNFLIDPTICPQMANECIRESKNVGVIEVGSGIGVLTKELALRTKKVLSVELDKRLIPILGETLKDFNNIKIINQDIFKINLKELILNEFADLNIYLCANIPYYISSDLIMLFLEQNLNIEALILMLQKETARRLCAIPGTKNTGAITLAINYYSVPTILFDVPRSSFFPAPDVDSSVIKLSLRKKPPVQLLSKSTFFKIIKLTFSQRRKTIINSLSSCTTLKKSDLSRLLKISDINLNARPEELSIEQFAQLSNTLIKFELI